MRKMTILTCTGYGNSGSSAGTNILEEFSSVYSFSDDFECTFLHETDGVGDLELALTEGHRLKVDLAVKRFLRLSEELSKDSNYRLFFNGKFLQYSRDYIDELVSVKWDGNWHRAFEDAHISKSDYFRIEVASEIYRRSIINKKYDLYEPDSWMPEYKPFIDEYYSGCLKSVEEERHFLDVTKKYLDRLFSEIPVEDTYEFILVDQLLPASDMSRYSRYFDTVKTLIIDRDPRDLYACNKADWGSRYIPSSDVDLFIEWFSKSRQPRILDSAAFSCVLFIPFESLIYDYEQSLERIRLFTGLKESDHIRKGYSFKPALSKQNTQLFRKHRQFSDDIEKIEKALSEYCYKYGKDEIRTFLSAETHAVFMEDFLAPADRVQAGRGTVAESGVSLCRIGCALTSSVKRFRRMKNKKGLRKIKAFLEGCLLSLFFPFEFLVKMVQIIILDIEVRRHPE